MRILLADDDPIIRMDLAQNLKAMGHEVLEAATGRDAWKLIEDLDHIGMVITIMHITGGNGITVAVKARQHHPNIPVLFVTGRSDPQMMEQVPLPYSYLLKPFTPEKFTLTVHQVIMAQFGGPKT
jgi:DNA-binding NtrC family response regulator